MLKGLFFTPKLPLNPILTSSLTWCSTRLQQRVADKSNLVLAQSVRSNPDCLQTCTVRIFFRPNLIILLSNLPPLKTISLMIQSWPSIGGINCDQGFFFKPCIFWSVPFAYLL